MTALCITILALAVVRRINRALEAHFTIGEKEPTP